MDDLREFVRWLWLELRIGWLWTKWAFVVGWIYISSFAGQCIIWIARGVVWAIVAAFFYWHPFKLFVALQILRVRNLAQRMRLSAGLFAMARTLAMWRWLLSREHYRLARMAFGLFNWLAAKQEESLER